MGAGAVVEGAGDGALDAAGGVFLAEGVPEHHGGGEDGGDGVGEVASSEVGCGAVDGFVEAARGVSEGCGGEQPDGASELRGLVGEDVAEHVGGDDDVEARGIADELHGGVVDEHVLEGDVGEFAGESVEGLAPESGGFEDVGLVDGGEMASAAAGALECGAGDAFDFKDGIGLGVEGLGAVGAVAASAFAEIDAAREFADDEEVEAVGGEVGAERGGVAEGGEESGGAQVGVEAEGLAEAEEGAFGAQVGGEGVPFGAADGAEEDAVGVEAGVEGVLWEGDAVAVDGGAAREAFGEMEVEASGAEDVDGGADDLGADAVARNERDAVGHGLPRR